MIITGYFQFKRGDQNGENRATTPEVIYEFMSGYLNSVDYNVYMVSQFGEHFNARFLQLGASAAKIPHGLYHMDNLGC